MAINDYSKGRTRVRVALACDSCRQRKTRCDGTKPICGNCAALGEECYYIPRPRQIVEDSQIAKINRRLEKIEQDIAELRGNKVSTSNKHPRIVNSSSSSSSSSSANVEKIPFPTFNDRLAHMKSHTSGNEESPTVYISDVFFSILSPRDISNLSRRLGDPLLGQKLENLSHGLWKSNQSIISRIVGPVGEFLPDPVFLNKCIEVYGSTTTLQVHPLVPIDIFEHENWCNIPVQLQKGISAAVLIYSGESMRFSSDYRQFSKDFVESQVEGAFYQAIRTLNLLHFSNPSFLQVRISVLLTWLLSVFTNVPSLFHFMDPLLKMARAIGLHRPDVNHRFSQREAASREHVWLLTNSLQYSLCINLSRRPFMCCQQPSSKISLEGLSHYEAVLFECDNSLHEIYNKVQDRLFSRHDGQPRDRDEVLHDIISLDDEIERWRSKTPKNLLEVHIPRERCFQEFVRGCPAGTLLCKYCHIMICIHSIPAFNPNYLTKQFPASLQKISESARTLLDLMLAVQEQKRGCGPINGISITTAICTLLHKQLCYSNDISNLSDLKKVQACLPMFKNEIWPSTGEDHALAATWKFLTDMMEVLLNPDAESENSLLSIWDEMLPEYQLENMDQCGIM